MDVEHVRIAVEALMREELVVDLYASRFYQIISHDENETRSVFGIPAGSRAADVVVAPSKGRAIVAEVKGSDLSHAVEQLRSTSSYVRRQYPFVEYKVFLKTATPARQPAYLRGGVGEEGRMGFRAVRVFHTHFPAEWLLVSEATNEFVRVDGEVVSVIFGPYVEPSLLA
jgi:hypothetical protein